MSESREPLVSICIPTYNGERYLDECLDSALTQTYQNYEVLVVDNQSSDDTVSIVKRHAGQDARIRLEQNQRNLGAVRNFNQCTKLARGDWVKFLFADDLLAPTCLETMLDGRRQDSAIVACRREIRFDGVDDETRREYAKFSEDVSIDGLLSGETSISPSMFCEVILDRPGVNFIGEPTAVLLHQSLFKRFGGFNPYFIEISDMEFWTRVGVNIGLAYVPETLATFRVHPGAMSADNRRERQYRREILDSAILLHEFVFNPDFAPLRAAAAKRRPRVDLHGAFVKRALKARIHAHSGAGYAGGRAMEEWKTAVARYPRLQSSIQVRMQWILRRLARRIPQRAQ